MSRRPHWLCTQGGRVLSCRQRTAVSTDGLVRPPPGPRRRFSAAARLVGQLGGAIPEGSQCHKMTTEAQACSALSASLENPCGGLRYS